MKKIKVLCILGLSLVVLAACGSKDKDVTVDTKESNKTEELSKPEKKADVYFKDDVLKIDMATLKILSTEVLPVDSGQYRDKPQLAFTYEVTNDSDEPISASSVWIACFELTQETENTIDKLNVGSTPQDDKFEEYRANQMSDIKPGGTLKAVIAYDIDNVEAPITLTATQGIAGTKLGEKTINLN